MTDIPRHKLCEIVTEYGQDVIDNPKRCKALLLDYCGKYKREVYVLFCAVEERIPHELLLIQNNIPLVVLIARLTRRLTDNRAITEDTARWAVESWALALGVALPEKTNESILPHSDPAMSVTEQQLHSPNNALSHTPAPHLSFTQPSQTPSGVFSSSKWDINYVSNHLLQAGWKDIAPGNYAGSHFDLVASKRVLITLKWLFLAKVVPLLDTTTATTWQRKLTSIRKKWCRPSIIGMGQPLIICLIAQRVLPATLAAIEQSKFGSVVSLKEDSLRGIDSPSILFIVDEESNLVHVVMPKLPKFVPTLQRKQLEYASTIREILAEGFR